MSETKTKVKRLSVRETEIVELLRKGLNNRDIALELAIDQKTVSTYIQRMRVKLGLPKGSNAYVIVTTYAKQKFPFND